MKALRSMLPRIEPRGRLLFAVVCLLFAAGPADGLAQRARSGGALGLGGQIGDPTGVTLKIYQRRDFAYNFLAAWNFDEFFSLSFHGEYERPIPDSPMRFYYGPGLVVGFLDRGDDVEVVAGISGIIGLNFFADRFEVFLHISPHILLIPETQGDLDGGVGLRFYF